MGGVMPAPTKCPVGLRDWSIRLVEDLFADPDLGLSVTGEPDPVARTPDL
jgi:hypothetical protein